MLSRSDPLSGQSESWPDRGAPERSTAWWLVERREALRPTSLGARGALPREVGTLIPPPRVPAGALAPPAAPPPRAGVARDWQTSDASRRENVKVWLFESVDQNFCEASTQVQRVGRNKRRISDAHCAALRRTDGAMRFAYCALRAPRAGRARDWQTSDASRRENAEHVRHSGALAPLR